MVLLHSPASLALNLPRALLPELQRITNVAGRAAPGAGRAAPGARRKDIVKKQLTQTLIV